MLFSTPSVLRVFWPVICAFVALSVHASTPSSPALWKVQKGPATVYLFGSMHFGAEDFYPLPEAVLNAFASADTLVVEVDITRIDPTQAMAAIMRYARLPSGSTLQKQLPESTYELLQQRAAEVGLPIDALQQFQPWFAAIQLVEAELRKTRFKQTLGLDRYFLTNAATKNIVQLESLDTQLGMFSELSAEEQVKFLHQTLEDFNQSQKYLDELATQWRDGDTEGLERTLLAPFRDSAETKSLYKAIFTDRNTNMRKAIERYLASPGTVFFVVGAGHMLGEDGIVAQLKSRGFHPVRVETDDVDYVKPASSTMVPAL